MIKSSIKDSFFKFIQILDLSRSLFSGHKKILFFTIVAMFFSSLLESINLAVLYPVINYGLKQDLSGTMLNLLLSLLIHTIYFFLHVYY